MQCMQINYTHMCMHAHFTNIRTVNSDSELDYNLLRYSHTQWGDSTLSFVCMRLFTMLGLSRWTCGIKVKNRFPSNELRKRL